MRSSFHVSLHAYPKSSPATCSVELQGRVVNALTVDPASANVPFGVTFEEVTERLQALPRMHVEPDGSFVWVSTGEPSAAAPSWQLDGVIYDRAGRVLYVDLKGTCPEAEWELLLRVFGWPQAAVMLQLSREAVFLDESTFRSLVNGQ